MNTVREDGVYVFEAGGQIVKLTEEDMLIEQTQREGYMAETSGDVGVVIETTLTDELIEEGFVREIISKVQTMRKEAGFEVMDHIRLGMTGNEKLAGVMERNGAMIGKEVLADAVEETLSGYEKEWNINGETASFSVEKL